MLYSAHIPFASTTAAVAAPAIHDPARAQGARWRMQTFLAASTPVTQNFEKLAVASKEKSGGAIDIAVLPLNAAVAAGETIAEFRPASSTGTTPRRRTSLSRPGFSVLGDTLSACPDPVMRDRWFTEGGGLALARQLYETMASTSSARSTVRRNGCRCDARSRS